MGAFDTPLERRRVLKAFLVAGPTLTLAARFGFAGSARAFPVGTPEAPEVQDLTDVFILAGTPTYYDLLIGIHPDNRVYLEVPRMEVGQGIMTTIGMMVADHLDVPFESLDIALSKAEPRRGAMGQLTAGSHATRSLWDPVRVLCAELRARLITAGAERLGVSPAACRTEDGHVVASDGRRVPYGEISEAAAKVAPKVAPVPKKSSDFKVIGRPHVRQNARDIVTGTAQFAMDVPVEGALPTVVALAASHGATVVSIDDSAARSVPGVVAVTRVPGMRKSLIPEAVAVTAGTFGQAKKAKDALKIEWTVGPMDRLSDPQIDDLLHRILEPVTAPDSGEGAIDAWFRWPYVPHAPLEPNDCVADVRSDRAEIWGGSQVPVVAQRQIAEALGFREDQVVFHVVPAGGSYGRRLFHDPHVHAAQVSQRIGRPVKLLWLREEDIRHGRARPVSIHHVRATIKGGSVASFEHRMACSEMDPGAGLGDVLEDDVTRYGNEGIGQSFFTHTQKLPYRTGPTSITLTQQMLAKPTGPWRNMYSGQVGAINEIVIDELARLLGRDEFEFRMEMLDTDQARAVLAKAAHEGQWGRKLPAGVGQGLGMHHEYKSICAYLMEIDVRGREPRLTRCTVAVDNGHCVNPTGTESSLFGQAMDGFALVFRAGLHVDHGVTRESNFHDFQWARMSDSPPEMQCFILPTSNALPGGIGELGVPAACAAAANAWARATGRPVRRFPINEHYEG